MPTLIVEDGSIVTGANTYISAADFSTFASDRGVTIVGDPATLVLLAMDWVDQLVFKGIKRTIGQPLQWPRVDVYIDTYYNQANLIPKQLLNGLCFAAIAIDQGTDMMQDMPRRTKMEKVGNIEVEYANGAASNAYSIKARHAMWKILDNGAGSGLRIGKG